MISKKIREEDTMKAIVKERKTKIKTYKIGEPNELPYFIEKKQYQGASGKVYPLKVVDQLSSETEDKEYNMVHMENEYIEVNLLPEIGGKIHGAKNKKNGYEFIYQNIVVKPALIGLCGPWVSGGVEFNWPQHHRPTTYSPVEYSIKENADGSCTCFMGEVEPFNRMRSLAEIKIFKDASLIEVKAKVTNHGDHALPFMWWNNTAVRVHKDYKCIFPPDVSCGADHDRRAITPFPIMKGRFETARPYDYGDGVDASWFENVKVQTSVMIPRYESNMDFVGGYDYKADAGTAIIGDHYIAPGKKMFTWADSEFGRKWSRNLTDNDDKYIELMTGAYTDNQPDFTYIESGETKEFVQYWYPISGIKNISNANKYGAVTLDMKDDYIDIGAVATGYNVSSNETLSLLLYYKDKIIYEKTGILKPDSFWMEKIKIDVQKPYQGYKLVLQTSKNRVLVSYTPVCEKKEELTKARPISPRPENIKSVEELYLHGSHLIQYKHGTYNPQDYFIEALNREPDDYRCNLEMGKIEIEKGDFKKGEFHLQKAYRRITERNCNPKDAESIYMLGRLKRLTSDLDEAYEYFKASSWQYQYRSASNFECACISIGRGDIKKGIEELEVALETNTKHYAAIALLGYVTKNIEMLKKYLKNFCQDSYIRYTLFLLTGEMVDDFLRKRAADVLDAALLYKKAGLYKEARNILETCVNPSYVLGYHLEALDSSFLIEKNREEYVDEFPRRLEDISVLDKNDWYAKYLLGCLYYDRENYEEAKKAFLDSINLNSTFSYTHRNLAFLYYDHLNNKKEAMNYMNKAVQYKSDNPRIIYEAMQLRKVENIDPKERLLFTNKHFEAIRQRDDAYLEKIILHIQNNEYKKAKELLRTKEFHIYEGGEGKLTKYHRWLCVLSALEFYKEKKYLEAKEEIEQATVYPDNYGEGEAIFKQDSNVYYFAGRIYELLGEHEKAQEEYKKVIKDSENINEILFYSAICYEKLGDKKKANELYEKLLYAGEEKLINCDLYGYFGVGMEAPLPFESDIRRKNKIAGYTYKMLGEFGLQNEKSYIKYMESLERIDPYNVFLNFFNKTLQMI